MENKVVLRADLKTEYMHNQGYICITENCVEGVFGLDYVRIDKVDKCLEMLLHENIYHIQEHKRLLNVQRDTIFRSPVMVDTEIYCPEKYLFSSDLETLILSLSERVTNRAKINQVFQDLECVRRSIRAGS